MATPWRSATVWISGVIMAVGAVAMLVAWSQASATVRVDQQVDWAPLSLAGASAMTLAMLFWIVSGRRAVAARVDSLGSSLPIGWTGAADAPVEMRSPSVDGLVATDKMIRFHRPTCPLVDGKTARPATRAAHEAAGRRPCGMCEP